MVVENIREQRGIEIAQLDGQIKRVDNHSYKVLSQSGNGSYDVLSTELGWICSCPDHVHRKEKCKHIWAVEISLKLREQVEKGVIIQPVTVSGCLFCHSPQVKKFGVRHNVSGSIQRFLCGDCKRTFSINIGFEKMKHNPQAVTSAMQLYFSGESLRNTMRSLRLLGVKVSHQTVYNWIKKYISLMKEYVEKLKPNVSDTWRADEMYVKIKGNMKYLFALMDDETRYWIAQEVADTKYSHDARSLFRKGKEATGKKPNVLITDGLKSYHEAYLREFRTLAKPRTEHIAYISIQGDRNNNKMERMNGEVRDREKVMRGIKRTDTPILAGYQIFHNYIRTHEGLNGKTPSEACGIQVKGENKWMTLIQNAKNNS
jgi:transposase-like protein